VAAASLIGLPAFALNLTDQVKINEVSYDPSEAVPATTDENPWEYIELYNAGTTVVYLDGAVISDEGSQGTAEATFKFPGTPGGTTIPLASHAYMLLLVDVIGSDLVTISPFKALASFEFYAGGTDTDDPTVPNLVKTAGTGTDLLLANAGDGVVLGTGASTGSVIPCAEVVDGASWENGGTGDTNAMSSTVCADPAANPGYTNGGPTTIQTIQRCPDGADTDNSAADFSVADRTPKAANGCNNIPPIITNLRYSPCYVTANAQVSILCTVTDDNNDIMSVTVYYELEGGVAFIPVVMTAGLAGAYSATLPGQADQAHVLYYVEAIDATGNHVKSPSTAPGFTRSYRVGLQTIASLQVPAVNDSCAASSQIVAGAGRACNVVGVVTHLPKEYSPSFFYIQQGIAANSGIKVFLTGADTLFVPQYGDSVRVSGYIDEFHCQTELVLFGDCGTILGHNRKVRARQLAAVADINKEENESMLVKVQGPIPILSGFDTTNLGQEFEIGAGLNIAYVGDDTFFPDGIGYTPVPLAGWSLDDITGIVGYRRVDTTTPGPRANQNMILRLEPRRNNDVNVTWTDVGPDGLDVVRAFGLKQNSPNPFNPVTTIEFEVRTPGAVQLRIYDARGQVVRTLLDREYATPRPDQVRWDGRDDAGQVVPSGMYFYKLFAGTDTATRKMLLLK
jgi:hypothetical protein